MKRYDASTGRISGMPEPVAAPPVMPPPPPPMMPPRPRPAPPPPFGGLLPGRLLPGLGELDNEDLLLLLILWLLYRESGELELLVIMAAMYLF
jgi:hypothetical protein